MVLQLEKSITAVEKVNEIHAINWLNIIFNIEGIIKSNYLKAINISYLFKYFFRDYLILQLIDN